MPRKSNTTINSSVVVARFAWLAAFVFPAILTGLLLAVSKAPAAPASPAFVPLAFEEELEAEEEGEFEETECEAAEEEFEEGELGQIEVEQLCAETASKDGKRTGDSGSAVPEECLLRSAHARAVADPEGGKLKLTVGYTTYEPTGATIETRVGSDRIGSTHRRLGRSGVLRIVNSLGKNQAPHRVVVRIRIPGSPSLCGKFQTQKVSVSGAGGDAASRRPRHSKAR